MEVGKDIIIFHLRKNIKLKIWQWIFLHKEDKNLLHRQHFAGILLEISWSLIHSSNVVSASHFYSNELAVISFDVALTFQSRDNNFRLNVEFVFPIHSISVLLLQVLIALFFDSDIFLCLIDIYPFHCSVWFQVSVG